MTVTLALSEAIMDAAITKLRAGLAARVAVINAADTAGVTITTPASFYLGGAGPLAPQEPAVIVTELPSQDYSEEGQHSFIFTTDLFVAVYDMDTDRQVLARKLLRQARAVVEVLWDDDPKEALTGSAMHLRPVRHAPGPVFEPTDDRTLWSALYGVVFRAVQLEP